MRNFSPQFVKKLFVVLFSVLLLCSIGVSDATAIMIYDLADDWSTATNNPAPWSYGKYASELNPDTFSLLTEHRYILGLSEWYNGPDDPNIIKNITSADVSAYTIAFHADNVTFGPYLGPAVARWTAPSAGTFQVDAMFATVQAVNSAPNAYVYDGTNLNDLGSVPAFGIGTVEYHQTLTVAAGQMIDFVVWGADAYNKTTEVSATINLVPEPATILLLGSGLVGLVGFKKRFRKK